MAKAYLLTYYVDIHAVFKCPNAGISLSIYMDILDQPISIQVNAIHQHGSVIHG